jgi:CheY-like chemotaxis protein
MEKKYLVLIADDHKENRTFLRKLLESTGRIVLEAENGHTALEAARLEIPDLIISDILMPVMDGYKFCMEVKNDERLKSIPFIFYTATYTEKKDEEFAMSLGALRFIIKPEEPAVLIGIIREYLEDYRSEVQKNSDYKISDEKEILKIIQRETCQ